MSNQEVKKEEQESKKLQTDHKTQSDRVVRAVRPHVVHKASLGRLDRPQDAVRPPGAEKAARGGQTALGSQFQNFLQTC